MQLFGKKKPATSRRPYRRKSVEETERAEELKRKRWAYDEALKKAKEDPVFAAKWASKLTGIEISTDPTEKDKRELRKKITEMALDQINKNPELRERATQAEIESIIGEGSGSPFFSEEGFPTSEGDFLSQLEYMERVKEKLGGGGISSLINKDVAIEILKLIQGLAVGGIKPPRQLETQQAPNLLDTKQRVYVIERDGKAVEISEEEFFKNLEQKMAKKEGKKAASEGVPQVETPESELDPAAQDMIEEIIYAIDTREPEHYVEELFARVQEGGEAYLANILTIASTLTFEEIVMKIIPYKDKVEYSIYVNKVLDNEEWCTKALAAVREKVNA